MGRVWSKTLFAAMGSTFKAGGLEGISCGSLLDDKCRPSKAFSFFSGVVIFPGNMFECMSGIIECREV